MSNRQPPDESPASTSPTIDEKGQSNLLASAALSASASSLASVASSKASVATTKSGIRPPSKIGRLCGDKHKPPVPASPPKSNELDDPLKKMIDEFGRHRLTDVLEEECEEEQSGRTSWNGSVNRKRYSSSSPASSMDALCWELHARRLSEAGLSRHSDSSTILTEDTDSFIIGQRVWVGGNKPGHIAFIGETQFAPGEWAGIALDEPIGKNDGSVSGIRYFMCEPKKGVFSRLTRLTRVPLDHGGSGDTFTFSTPPPSNNSVRKSPMSPSPTESHRSIMKSPVSAHGSNTSLSSAHVDYKIGDRVIIKSGQGSKVGTVKFMGVTEFAPGEWVGVELDEPRGKNDGSVNGIRYFECQPNFGLFSPISKVSKSPSKIKPNQCQIHSPIGGGLPPSGLKRANSKESMTSNLSMMSSASTAARGVRLGVTSLAPKKVPTKLSATPVPTRTALQDVLKEKQQHIEQLLKERDLERAEITRAASQADEAEQKLSVLTQEYTKYRAECESQLQTHIELLNKLKESRQELVTQLEDEKKKNEDWQFRFEEAEITRADLEVSNEANLSKIKELEASLASEKEKGENLEADVNKLFETEENLIKTKEEVENLKKELQETKNKHVMLKGDTATTTVLIKSLQDDLDQSIKDCDEKSVMIDVLKKEISNFQIEQASFKKQLELAANQIEEIIEKSTLKDKNIELLKSELDNVNKIASEKSKTVEQLQAENLIIGDEFVEKLAKKDEELIKYQASNEDNSKTIEKLNKEIENIKIEAETKNNELCELHKKTVAELNQAVVNLSTQNEKLQKDLETQIEEKNKIIEELNKKLSERNEKIEQLQRDLENSKTTSKQSFAELEIKYQKDIDSQKTKINELSTELNHKINYSSKLNEELSTLRASLENKTKEYENLNSEHEKIKTKLEEDLESKSEELKKAIDAINNNSNIIHSLQTELQTTKLDLETASKDLLQYQTNLSDVEAKLKKERDELHESLKIKLTEFDNLKKELADTIIAKDKSLAELSGEVTEKLEIINKLNNDLIRQKEESKKIINELVEKHKKVLEENALNISQNNTEIVKKHEEINQLNINISKLESSFMDKNAEFDKLKSEMHNILEENKADSERVKNLSNEVETLNISNANLESKCKEMEEFKLQLEKIKNELEIQLNAKNNDLTESIENLTKKDSQISQLISELNSAKVETEKLSQELLLYQSNLSNVENNLKQERDDIKLELNKAVDELSTLKEKLNIKYVETENLIQENNSIKLELLEKHKEFDKVKDELMLLNNNLEEKLSNEDRLKQQLNEAKSELSSKSAELQAVKNDLSRISKDLEEKLSEAHNLLAEKTKQIHEKQDEIIQMNENQKKFINDLMEDHKTKLQENDTKLKNWQNDMKIKIEEINKLNENINNLKMLVSTKDDQMEKLNKELTELKSSNKESASHISETNKAIETLEKDNQIYKNKLETLENELAKIKSEKELLDLKIQQTTSNTSSRVSELEKKLIEKDEIIESLKLETKKSKSDSEKLIKEQTEKIKAVEYSENLLKNMIAETEAKQANTLKTNVNSLQGEINKRDITIASKDNEISKLKDQLSKVQTTTTALNGGTSDNVAKSNGTTDYQQLLEEKIFAENQVAFLNSIIVDMQKKNEEQQMRIEILEKGYSPAAAEELHQLGFNVSERQVAPRMYCDICEEFDLHETEDCPTQASDEPASNVQLGKEKKGKPPPRPYCNICEEFGHDTADCTDDQEF